MFIQASIQRLLEYTVSPNDDGKFYFDSAIAQQALDLWADDIIPSLMERSSESYLMDSAS